MDFSLAHIADAVREIYHALGAHLPAGLPAFALPAIIAGGYFLLMILCGSLAKWRGQSFYWGFFLSLFVTPFVAVCFIPFINPSQRRKSRSEPTARRRRSPANSRQKPRAVTRSRRRATVKR